MSAADDTLRSGVREILLHDWDPHNAAGHAAAAGSYDGYIEPLIALLRSGAGEEQVVEFLHEREKESMCFPSLGAQRLRRPAGKLIELAAGSAAGVNAHQRSTP